MGDASVGDRRWSHGYIEHLSRVRDGDAWPQVHYRVYGTSSPTDIVRGLLRADGTWWDAPDGAGVFAVPGDCTMTHAQLARAVELAGIRNRLPFHEHDRFTRAAPIEYGPPASPTPAVEEWRPRAPVWRGGKPWR